jgi:hypothetical protein
LIDSIINGFDVPKIYMADFQLGQSPLNQKRLPYAIIDGKQRFEAIFDFFEGTLTLDEQFKWREDPRLNLGGLSLRDLRANHTRVADAFENASFDVMSVFASDDTIIHDLFVRLNRSKPLTGAELRNAIVGPVPEVVRQIASHPFFEDNIKFSTKRAEHLNTATKFILFEYNDGLSGTKKSNLDLFAVDDDVDPTRLQLASIRTLATLDAMQEVFLPRDMLLASSGTVPVYYWFIRSIPSSELHLVREFLVNFELTRRNVDMPASSDTAEWDSVMQFFSYTHYNRSTNDVASHVGRFNILSEKFAYWKKHRKL